MRHLRLPTFITRADTPAAIFGSWDGCISVLAVMVGLAASGHIAGAVAAGCAGAVGGMFSMATGQYESDSPGPGRVRRAVVMGAATGVGGMLPVLPYFLPGPWQARTVTATCLAVALASVVAYVKAHTDDDPAGLTLGELSTSYLLLAVTAAATYAVGLAA